MNNFFRIFAYNSFIHIMKSLFNIFLDSILHFFSLGGNPIEKCKKERQKRTDMDNIAQDWYNVGNDIRSAYERFKSC